MVGAPYPERFLKPERRKTWIQVRHRLLKSNPNFNAYQIARYQAFVLAREFHYRNKSAWPFVATTQKALRLATHEIRISWPELSPRFDGYRILHLTDLHLDHMDETAKTVATCAEHHGDVDLCVITGDFRDDYHIDTEQTLHRLEIILKSIKARDGCLCVFGNHDGPELLDPLEELGVHVLLNESVSIARGNETIGFTGLDDVHMFHTQAATEALRNAPDGFNIALVHSPEVAHIAAENHDLYLTGHTHGGQICLPGGRAISTALRANRHYASGLWRHGKMIGYTSHGAGTSGVPIRLNCPGEVSVVTLLKGPRSVSIDNLFVDLWDD